MLISGDRGVLVDCPITHDSLLEASHFVHAIEQCQGLQGLQVACLEEIAYNNR
ncbi:Glucose-1-phosphate thymidylyltransferase 2 [compost metagenome]